MASAKKDKLGEQLSAYLDGELTAEERARLEALLAEDPQVRAALAELKDEESLPKLRAMLAAPSAPDRRSAVMNALARLKPDDPELIEQLAHDEHMICRVRAARGCVWRLPIFTAPARRPAASWCRWAWV